MTNHPALRIALTKKADRIACSYMVDHPMAGCHVCIRVIQRRSWLARLFLGNPYGCLSHA